jgi:hypothetical protein
MAASIANILTPNQVLVTQNLASQMAAISFIAVNNRGFW